MSRLIVKASLIVLTVFSVLSCGSSLTADDYLSYAEKAFEDKDYITAIDACDRALELDDKDPDGYYLRGFSYYLLFRTAEPDDYDSEEEYAEIRDLLYANCISDCTDAIKYSGSLDEEDAKEVKETCYYCIGYVMYEYGKDGYKDMLKNGGEDGLELLRDIEKHEAALSNQSDVYAFDQYSSQGSGFLIDPTGFIATNNHVIEGVDDDDIEVWFDWTGDRRSYEAKVVVTDPENDLAILRITSKRFKEMDPLPYIISSEQALTGTEVFTLGYPDIFYLGGEIKMTKGVISSTSGFQGDRREYQIDANIHGGNSGGPLFDENGRLIGINSSSFIEDANIHYSIKSSMLLDLIKENRLDMDIPQTSGLDTLSLPQKVKAISPYVVLITNK